MLAREQTFRMIALALKMNEGGRFAQRGDSHWFAENDGGRTRYPDLARVT